MSSRVCVTGHRKDPVPLSEKSRASCPGRRFPPSSIHQVIIITGLNKLWLYICSRPEGGLRCRQGVKPSLLERSCYTRATKNVIVLMLTYYIYPIICVLYTL